MRVRQSRVLVVDADIAAFCSERNLQGEACRDFLEAAKTICHRVVLTADITEEWARHQSRWFRKWLRGMFAKKKQANVTDPGSRAVIRQRIERLDVTEEAREAMLKDSRLIEAALATDKIVVSRDDTARRLFSAAASSIGELGEIMWVNPDAAGEDLIAWLEEGAPPETTLLLGASSE